MTFDVRTRHTVSIPARNYPGTGEELDRGATSAIIFRDRC